jgi:DNA invertase Pin-like site-specific DNA recombinase
MTQEPHMPVVLFARVSSEAQDFGRQLRGLERHAERAGYQVVEELADLKVSVFALNIQLGSLLPDGKPNLIARLVMTVLMEVDEMETERLGHRIRSGQDKAFAAGAQKGRPVGTVQDSKKLLAKYPKVVNYLEKALPVREIAELARCSTNTVLKVKAALSS